MSIQLQFRRGNTAQTAVFTGAVAELTVDTDKNTIILHDGVTAGGYALARESSLSSNQAFAQAAYDKANAAFDEANTKFDSAGGTISGDVIVTGNVSPTTDNVYSLGSASYRWKDIFVGAGTVDIDGVKLSKVDGQLVISGATDLILSGTNLPSSLNTANNISNAFNQANLAFDAANTSFTAGGARAFDQANLAFDKANSAWDYANSAYGTANNEILTRQANVGAAVIAITGAYEANVGEAKIIALGRADSAFAQANLAFDAANNVAPQIQPTRDVANSAFAQANLAYDTANSGYGVAVSGFAQANLAYDKANSAWDYANSAFATANTKLDSAGGTISGDLVVSGNLSVTGNVTTYDSQDLIINDPIVLLANNNTGNVIDIGFVGHYEDGGPNTKHTGLIKDVSANLWYLFDNYEPHIQETNIFDPDDSTLRIANLKANVITDVITLRGLDPLDYANTIQSTAQANVGAAVISITNAYQANVGAARIADTAAAQANVGSAIAQGQANVGAGLIAVTSAYQSNVGVGLITKVDKSGDTMTGTLSTSGSLIGSSITANTIVTVNTHSVYEATAVTTGSLSQIVLDSFSTTAYRSAKYLVQITSGSEYELLEMTLIHDGTTVYLSQYGNIKTGATLGVFDATISAGTLSLLATPNNAVTTFKTAATLIPT